MGRERVLLVWTSTNEKARQKDKEHEQQLPNMSLAENRHSYSFLVNSGAKIGRSSIDEPRGAQKGQV